MTLFERSVLQALALILRKLAGPVDPKRSIYLDRQLIEAADKLNDQIMIEGPRESFLPRE